MAVVIRRAPTITEAMRTSKPCHATGALYVSQGFAKYALDRAAVGLADRPRAWTQARGGGRRPPAPHSVRARRGASHHGRAGALPLLRLHVRRRQAVETRQMPGLPRHL